MFDLVIEDNHTDRQLLIMILKELHKMAVDTSKLTVALAKLNTDVDTLIAAHNDPAAQQAVDAAAAAVEAVDAKVLAAVTPAAPVAAS